jgi:hypothetical protein
MAPPLGPVTTGPPAPAADSGAQVATPQLATALQVEGGVTRDPAA